MGTVHSFPKFSDTHGGFRSLARQEIGQHNDEIYRNLLGMGEAEIARLKAADAI